VIVGRSDVAERWAELATVRVPVAGTPPRTTVESIEPGVHTVPENLLRFAVTFSDAMEAGSAAGRIRLLDDRGEELAGALLEMPPELWDGEHRRLTVLLEPGRIKRGLQPNARAGPPLVQGSTVTLVVGADIRDSDGLPLVSEARRSFLVGPPVRSRIDPALWQVDQPKSSTGPLVVRFDRPLDRVLALRYVRALDRHGHSIVGSLNVEGTVLTFANAGESKLRVDARLEDLAGNSVRRVFDRDLENPATAPLLIE
jgi:hypothetical protein